MKGIVSLSRRMQAAADLISPGNRVCDVGCDHGYVSIYLAGSGKAPRVLAMDVNEGPLLRAKAHVRKYHMEDYITLRLSDGLCSYRAGEADSLLCAGMGGRLMSEILGRDWEKTSDFKELVLQPQSEIPLFRKFLRENGYRFVEETMVLEDGKFYPMMKVERRENLPARDMGQVRGENHDILLQDMLGPLLLERKDPVLLQFVNKEIRGKREILDRLDGGEAHRGRRRELIWELGLLKKGEDLLKG